MLYARAEIPHSTDMDNLSTAVRTGVRARSSSQAATWILHRNEGQRYIDIGQTLDQAWAPLFHALLNCSSSISIQQLHRLVPDEPFRDLCMFVLTFIKAYRAGTTLRCWELEDDFVTTICETDGALLPVADILSQFFSPRHIVCEASSLVIATTDNTLGGSMFENVLLSVCLGWMDCLAEIPGIQTPCRYVERSSSENRRVFLKKHEGRDILGCEAPSYITGGLKKEPAQPGSLAPHMLDSLASEAVKRKRQQGCFHQHCTCDYLGASRLHNINIDDMEGPGEDLLPPEFKRWGKKARDSA